MIGVTFDTNVLFYYVFGYLDKAKERQVMEITEYVKKNNQKKIELFLLNSVKQELESSATKIFDVVKVLVEKELPDNWDAMSYIERDNLLSEIDKNFYEKFRRVYTAKYTDRNLDDKAKIGHRFFRTFRHKLVTRAKQEILLDVLGNNYMNILTYHIIEKLGKDFESAKYLNLDTELLQEIQLIEEKIINGYIKRHGKASDNRSDRIIFKEIYLTLRGNMYDKIIFFTEDYDQREIYNILHNSLTEFVNSVSVNVKSDVWMTTARRILDTLNNLRVLSLSEKELLYQVPSDSWK
ncbi:hypothetical protein [Metallosphaera javensis (ex Sakai et al. 2022)]|uniref:hypothetical protein n=1 Tax=Metallosphaera javensis (ex Sakai et al. 2022) TaxID=2775498 RepID=UPI0025846D28|nr:MAG: hypothetical protein MjAS7_2510 [Metallosphaera javensis (ex Sakai et al. 2022)]